MWACLFCTHREETVVHKSKEVTVRADTRAATRTAQRTWTKKYIS